MTLIVDTMETYVQPDKHRKPENSGAFLAQLNERERELHKMAERILGSSYFIDRTHSYVKWKKTQAT